MRLFRTCLTGSVTLLLLATFATTAVAAQVFTIEIPDMTLRLRPVEECVYTKGGGAYFTVPQEYEFNTKGAKTKGAKHGQFFVRPRFGDWGQKWLMFNMNDSAVYFYDDANRRLTPTSLQINVEWDGTGGVGTKQSGLTGTQSQSQAKPPQTNQNSPPSTSAPPSAAPQLGGLVPRSLEENNTADFGPHADNHTLRIPTPGRLIPDDGNSIAPAASQRHAAAGSSDARFRSDVVDSAVRRSDSPWYAGWHRPGSLTFSLDGSSWCRCVRTVRSPTGF